MKTSLNPSALRPLYDALKEYHEMLWANYPGAVSEDSGATVDEVNLDIRTQEALALAETAPSGGAELIAAERQRQIALQLVLKETFRRLKLYREALRSLPGGMQLCERLDNAKPFNREEGGPDGN